MNREILQSAGIDYDQGVARLLGDDELYAMILSTFPDDRTFAEAEAAYAARDYPKLFRAAHSLKGVCGNLDITALFTAASELTELVRDNPAPDEARVAALFTGMRAAYDRACEGIRKAAE